MHVFFFWWNIDSQYIPADLVYKKRQELKDEIKEKFVGIAFSKIIFKWYWDFYSNHVEFFIFLIIQGDKYTISDVRLETHKTWESIGIVFIALLGLCVKVDIALRMMTNVTL